MPEAERLALEAFQYGQAAHVRGAQMFYGAHILSIRDREDRLAEVIPMIEFGIQQSGEFALLHTSLVRALVRAGNRETAVAKWEGLAQAGFDGLAPNYLRLSMLCSLAEAAALIGDGERATSLYALLLPYRALNLQTGMMACFGSVERYLALAAAASGDVENAIAHFESAIAANDARGLDVAAATARIELAELFVSLGQPERARPLAAAALTVVEAAGAPQLALRASSAA
jgi:tetratricopeptide (TPR) repeat protein